MTANPHPHSNPDCRAVSELLSRVGDKWTVLIVKSLVARTCRFNELKREIGGIIKKQEDASRRNEGRSAQSFEGHRAQLEAYEAFADELGVEPAQLALAWLLHQPAVTGPITGPRTPEQLTSILGTLDLKLDQAALARLDEIFPGYKTAPEDYAW